MFILNSVFISVILSIKSAEPFKSRIFDASSIISFNLAEGSSACAISAYTFPPSFPSPYLYLIYSNITPLLNKSTPNIPICQISNFSLVSFSSLFEMPSGGINALLNSLYYQMRMYWLYTPKSSSLVSMMVLFS